MKRVGAYMAILGAASLILPYLGYELRLLSALDKMGATGIMIKVAIIGAGIFLFMRKTEESENTTPEDTQQEG